VDIKILLLLFKINIFYFLIKKNPDLQRDTMSRAVIDEGKQTV
jgi:hypothetical protein